METEQGYKDVCQAIAAGQATAHSLWVLLSAETDRDGYALKPMPWEGSGEYQRVEYSDGRDGLVRVPADGAFLPRVERGAQS